MPRRRYGPSRRFKPKRSRLKKIFRSRLFWFALVGVFTLGASAYGVFFTPLLQIKDIEIHGNQKISTEEVKRVLQKHANHFLLVNTAGIAERLYTAFPEIELVGVEKRFPDSLRVQIQERQRVAVWCQERRLQIEVQDENEGNERSFRECFALDKRGVIFEKKEPEGEVIISGEGIVISLSDRAVEEHNLARMLEFQKALDGSPLFQEVGLRVSSLHIVSKERVHVKISEGWEVYFNPTEGIHWQITKGKLVLEQEIPFQRRPFLEYIDLRFGDQAYIKYR